MWLIGVLALSVGAPFAAASATAPLLQSWYARTGRADAQRSVLSLRRQQSRQLRRLAGLPGADRAAARRACAEPGLVGGYVAGRRADRYRRGAMAITAHGDAPKPLEHTGPAPTWRQRGYWIAAAAVPSALSLGVTLHISTDVASAPMLWVVPLALYLADVRARVRARQREAAKRATLLHPSRRARADADVVLRVRQLGRLDLAAFWLASSSAR